MKTNSVENAYFRPLRGDDGAGDGGRSLPSRSIFANILFSEGLERPSCDSGGDPEDIVAPQFKCYFESTRELGEETSCDDGGVHGDDKRIYGKDWIKGNDGPVG